MFDVCVDLCLSCVLTCVLICVLLASIQAKRASPSVADLRQSGRARPFVSTAESPLLDDGHSVRRVVVGDTQIGGGAACPAADAARTKTKLAANEKARAHGSPSLGFRV